MIQHKTIPITNAKATRYWVGMREANQFVMECIEYMDNLSGGEIFVPKIPSVNIMDIYTALTKGLVPFSIIGDRVGDKLHETLISKEEIKHSVDIGNKYIIYPEDPHYSYTKPKGYGCGYVDGYTSDNNEKFLTISEITTTLAENQ